MNDELAGRMWELLGMPLDSEADLLTWTTKAQAFHRWVREQGVSDEVPHEFWHYVSDGDIYRREPEARAEVEAVLRRALQLSVVDE